MALLSSPDIDGCVNASRTLCVWDETHHMHHWDLYAVGVGDLIEVDTSDLKTLGGSTADTVLYLLRCDDSTCADGDIVASDDDGNSATSGGTYDHLDSAISFTATQAGIYRVIVTNYEHGREGTADVEIAVNSTVLLSLDDKVFGGWHVRGKELRDRDQVFVGKNGNDSPTAGLQQADYADSKILVLSTLAVDCDTGTCGRFQMNDDVSWGGATVRVSRVTLDGPTITASRIIVGTYDLADAPGYVMNARLFHRRTHTTDNGAWTQDDQRDDDGDGLTRELETTLGTCDSYTLDTGVDLVWTGGNCADVRGLVNGVASDHSVSCAGTASDPSECWSPRDSDNDGMEDTWELWAAAFSCTKVPAEPTNDAGTCTAIDLLATSPACPGAWCVAEPLSAMTKPDPSVHDVYMQIDTLGCDASSSTCAALHPGDPSHAHLLTSAQMSWVSEFWSQWPSTCWDGSSAPCPHANDRRYRISAHLLPQHTWRLPDDDFGWEIFPDWHQASTYFNRQFGGIMRYGGIAHYVLGTHTRGGGQTGNNGSGFERIAVSAAYVSGDATEDQNRLVDPLFHEVGHQLDLHHSHGKNTCSTGCGTACTDLQRSCYGGSCPIPCDTVQHHNPNHPSIMSYSYQDSAGFLPKSPTPPSVTATAWSGCEPRHANFSKGINPPLDESALNETQAETWATRKRAQELFCYDGWNDSQQFSPYAFKNPGMVCVDGLYFGPFCDGSYCYFNWDSSESGTAQGSAYAHDINRTDSVNSGTCADDLVYDRDEWATAIGWGRVMRGKTSHWPLYRIYAETFNGGVSGNIAGWDLSPTVGATINDKATYPRGGCYADSDCGGATCAKDTCTPPDSSTCLAPLQGCSGGLCGCTENSHCRSGTCLADGTCASSWGACACAGNTCTGNNASSCIGGLCQPMSATTDRLGNERQAKESASFNGAGQSISIAYGGSTHAFAGVEQRDSFELSLEFRFDGFTGNEPARVIVSSGHAELSVVKSGGAAVLESRFGSQTLKTPSSEPIVPGLWYRVRWAASESSDKHVIDLKKWRVGESGFAAAACVVESQFTADVTLQSQLIFGHDGSADASRYFPGRMDNIQLSNYWLTLKGAVPAGCVEQP